MRDQIRKHAKNKRRELISLLKGGVGLNSAYHSLGTGIPYAQ
jgi:hypothetical protein